MPRIKVLMKLLFRIRWPSLTKGFLFLILTGSAPFFLVLYLFKNDKIKFENHSNSFNHKSFICPFDNNIFTPNDHTNNSIHNINIHFAKFKKHLNNRGTQNLDNDNFIFSTINDQPLMQLNKTYDINNFNKYKKFKQIEYHTHVFNPGIDNTKSFSYKPKSIKERNKRYIDNLKKNNFSSSKNNINNDYQNKNKEINKSNFNKNVSDKLKNVEKEQISDYSKSYLENIETKKIINFNFTKNVNLNSKVSYGSSSMFNFNENVYNKFHSQTLNFTPSNRFQYITKLQNKVLLVLEKPYTIFSQHLIILFESIRIKFKVSIAKKSLPSLTFHRKNRYGIIVFERLETYLNMDKFNRDVLDKYCFKFSLGIIAFANPDEPLVGARVKDFPLYIHSKLTLNSYRVSPQTPVYRITKPRSENFKVDFFHEMVPYKDWTVFFSNHSTYEAVSLAKLSQFDNFPILNDNLTYIPVIRDKGLFDGIERIFFGISFKFWLHRLLFLDALSYLSRGNFMISLEKYIMVDIDDIFVGLSGLRMKRNDVKNLINSQNSISQIVDNFHYNLGFSGKYFHHGTEEENDGDDALLENKNQFWWFGHTYSHIQAHNVNNLTNIIEEMQLNKAFAKSHSIPVNHSYSVAPHHSGVYPVHKELYEAWKTVWNIKVTSTEEYPHLKPARKRRGFQYENIMVLPRQLCGLFTHTNFFTEYPGGTNRLVSSIMGGELFQTILFNKINIYMTHLSNYGNDRLATYTFESLFKFVDCYTNFKLRTVEPLELANIYFNSHPNEIEPIWNNPCDDKRHMAIWSLKKSCKQFPSFIIIGPQKTGTTALYTYLKLHPDLVSNYENKITYEEIQFFTDQNYEKGIDWYMEQFPIISNISKQLFEKSANYFNSEKVPERVLALLPRVKLICTLINPAKRAYSWYHHQVSHNDPVAKIYSFYEVITANHTSASQKVLDLQRKCLYPGLYAYYLEKWLYHFDSTQLLIIDGEVLKNDPITVLDKVQDFLEVSTHQNYSELIKYEPKKGFYCQLIPGNKKAKCLGPSKGRTYPSMDTPSINYLKSYYRKANTALNKLLLELKQVIPPWLEEELNFN